MTVKKPMMCKKWKATGISVDKYLQPVHVWIDEEDTDA